jgi:predicted ABC-type ATPase
LLRSARDAGYQTILIFVALATPDLHVLRVRQRVALGGHHIPEDVIRRRYRVVFSNLAECLRLSETILIFDNSADGARLVMDIEGPRIVRNHADASNAFDRRIAESVAAGLAIPLDHILPSAR